MKLVDQAQILPWSIQIQYNNACPNFALYHQKMNRTTTNQAPRTPPEDREGHGHYFTPAQAKVRGVVKFCEPWAWNSLKKMCFELSRFLTVKAMNSYAMTCLRADYTMIPIRKKLVGAADLLAQRNYVKWSVFYKKKALKHAHWHRSSWGMKLDWSVQNKRWRMIWDLYAIGYIHYNKGWQIRKTARDRKAWA